MTAGKTADSLERQAFKRLNFKNIRDMEQKGLLEDGEDFVKLTDRGIDVSNYVMSEFLL